jgi:hypothetical protein
VAAFQRVTERVTALRAVLAGLAAGAAFATKFSAVVLIPILIVLASVVVLSRAPLGFDVPRSRPRTATGRLSKLAVLAGALAVMAAAALALLWATYTFEARMTRDADAALALGWARLERPGLVGAGLRALHASGLVPDAYVYGLATVVRDSASRPAFLFGEIREGGWWYYFPVTFALKTPLALIGLLILLVLRRRGASGPRPRAWLFVWTPVAIYAAAAMASGLDIGHRHLLPIYPFLFAAAGAGAAWALAARGAARFAVLVLCAWYGGSVLRVHPHYLAYFNELAGGPAGGWRYLADSNVDWGQDLRGLKRWMDDNGVDHVKLSYFGTADPAYYGISCDRLPGKTQPDPSAIVREIAPGDVVAASVTNLQGVFLTPEERRFMRRLRDSTAVARVGYSIFIYRPRFAASVRDPGLPPR